MKKCNVIQSYEKNCNVIQSYEKIVMSYNLIQKCNVVNLMKKMQCYTIL